MNDDSGNKLRERKAAPRFQGRMSKLPYIVLAMALIFVIAIGIAWSAVDILDRPGHDYGTTQKAPAD